VTPLAPPDVRARRAVSAADRLAAAAIGHSSSAESRKIPLDLFQAVRLRLALRARGEWWLLEVDGEPVSTLMCYPLAFGAGRDSFPGYGLGAVATRPEVRCRGYATALCRAVIEAADGQGRAIGLLFSAIPPGLYERMGFVVAPAGQPTSTRPLDLAASGARSPLVPLDPRREAASILSAYEAWHPGLRMRRDLESWPRSLEVNPTDVFFGLPSGGYLRLCVSDPAVLEVVETIAPPEEAAAALRAVADLAARHARTEVAGWFDTPAEVASFFEDRGRATTLPMLRGWREVATARFWSSDYF
jgi:predicted N-acetyltransferase YhbS